MHGTPAKKNEGVKESQDVSLPQQFLPPLSHVLSLEINSAVEKVDWEAAVKRQKAEEGFRLPLLSNVLQMLLPKNILFGRYKPMFIRITHESLRQSLIPQIQGKNEMLEWTVPIGKK